MSGARTPSRGQVVLLAAFVLAVALVPVVVAYLQLGYDTDLTPQTDRAPETDAERLLDRAVYDAAGGVPDSYSWNERARAVQTVRDRLDPTVRTLERARLSDGIAYRLSYNANRASNWASEHCDRGPDRQFGPCESIRGVVVQERSDRTHVLAVAFDLSVTTPDGERRLTTVRRLI